MDRSCYMDRYDVPGTDVECNATGGLTLTTSQTPATPASMAGTIEFNSAELDFTGLVAAGAARWTLAKKECDDEDDEDTDEDTDDDDTFDDADEPLTITVMDVRDDRGHPFVRVTWKQAHNYEFYVIGKRQKAGFKSRRSKTGKILDLTEEERERLREAGEVDPEPQSDSE